MYKFLRSSIGALITSFALVSPFSANAETIYAMVSSNDSDEFCHFQLSDNNPIANTGCYGPDDGFVSVAPDIEPTDTWRHITMTIGSGTANIYIDGILTQSNSITTDNITPSSAVSIARGFQDSRYFWGSLDEVAIYDSVLSADRVLSHYAAGTFGGDYATEVLADNPLGYWRLDETSGTIAVDSSGNGLDGTYIGGVTLGTSSAFTSGNSASATFDGSSGYVSLPGSWGDSPEITIEAWASTVVPIPAAVYLFASGLGLLGWFRRRQS